MIIVNGEAKIRVDYSVELDMTEELKLCEHNNYHCYRCEVKLLKSTIDELEQQNKQLIDSLQAIANKTPWNIFTAIEMKSIAEDALQQIQGKDEERWPERKSLV